MARIQQYQGYSTGRPPTIPKPDHAVDPIILTVQEGVPVAYPDCHGVGVRVVHPVIAVRLVDPTKPNNVEAEHG
jgi:hypothetical protein